MPHPDPARTLINLPQPKLTITKKEVHALVDGDTSGLYTGEMAPSRRALSNPCYARLHPVGSATRPWTDRRSCSCNPFSQTNFRNLSSTPYPARKNTRPYFTRKRTREAFPGFRVPSQYFYCPSPVQTLFNRMTSIEKSYFQQNVTGAAASITEIIILLSVAFWRKPRNDRH